MNVILYSKPGCHLCEGMEEKLSAIQSFWPFELEIRDILTNPEWFERYQYTIPVIQIGDKILPPQSPHIQIQQLQRLLVRMKDASEGTTS
jgi:glutaredoxin